jgi:hypothetical protein
VAVDDGDHRNRQWLDDQDGPVQALDDRSRQAGVSECRAPPAADRPGLMAVADGHDPIVQRDSQFNRHALQAALLGADGGMLCHDEMSVDGVDHTIQSIRDERAGERIAGEGRSMSWWIRSDTDRPASGFVSKPLLDA